MTHPLFDLTGRCALITGSSQGLGFVMARGLAQAGATLILNGRDADKLVGAVTALREEGFTVHSSPFDVRDSAGISAAINQIEQEIGPIDILVNNAGIQRRGPFEDFAEDDWDAVIDTNLSGIYRVTQAVARGMIARQRGKIINIGSLMSEVSRPTIAPYTAAKGGVKMLTKALAAEWAQHNIQVNAIGPGYFATELNRVLHEDPEFNAWIKHRTPAGRWGDPAELIGPAIFLASEASNFVNGHILYVDGGMLATL